MKLSIIIPAYNEEKRIENTLKAYCYFFEKYYKDKFEIIVVMNGCKDNTSDIVKNFAENHKSISYLFIEEPIGKGGAIIKGFKSAKGELVGFTDADNSTSPEAFNDLIRNINGYDGIIASRWIKGAIVEPKQPLKRRIASRMFNLLVRSLFGIMISDSQCGAKLFKKEAIHKIINNLGITRWAFDVDLLYQFKRNNLKIKEIPTIWKDSYDSTLNLTKASAEMFFALARLRLIYSPFRGFIKIYDKLPERLKIHHYFYKW